MESVYWICLAGDKLQDGRHTWPALDRCTRCPAHLAGAQQVWQASKMSDRSSAHWQTCSSSGTVLAKPCPGTHIWRPSGTSLRSPAGLAGSSISRRCLSGLTRPQQRLRCQSQFTGTQHIEQPSCQNVPDAPLPTRIPLSAAK